MNDTYRPSPDDVEAAAKARERESLVAQLRPLLANPREADALADAMFEIRGKLRTAQAERDAARAEVEAMRRKLDIAERKLAHHDQRSLCPDCTGKVQAGTCPRCHGQSCGRAERDALAERVKAAEAIITATMREIPCGYIPNHKPENMAAMVQDLVRLRVMSDTEADVAEARATAAEQRAARLSEALTKMRDHFSLLSSYDAREVCDMIDAALAADTAEKEQA